MQRALPGPFAPAAHSPAQPQRHASPPPMMRGTPGSSATPWCALGDTGYFWQRRGHAGGAADQSLPRVRHRWAVAGKEQWPCAAGTAGSGVARATGSAEHLPGSWHCLASVPAVLGAAVTASWTCRGCRYREPLFAASTAVRGSTAGGTQLRVTPSPHPAVPDRLPVPRSPALAPCPQLGQALGDPPPHWATGTG